MPGEVKGVTVILLQITFDQCCLFDDRSSSLCDSLCELRDARIELVDQAGSGAADRPHVHVNRYAVTRVVSSLMLGYYFPGASLLTPETVATG
jgi:hypothetical protein